MSTLESALPRSRKMARSQACVGTSETELALVHTYCEKMYVCPAEMWIGMSPYRNEPSPTLPVLSSLKLPR